MTKRLTKTEFLIFRESKMHFWAFRNNRLDKEFLDSFTQSLFEQGKQIHKLAREYISAFLMLQYPEGNDFILEQKFLTDTCEVRVDLIIRVGGEEIYDLFEIKSSTKVNRLQIEDLAFQKAVVSETKIIRQIGVIHLNPEYVRGEQLDVQNLFVVTDVSDQVEEIEEEIKEQMLFAVGMTKQNNPDLIESCRKPRSCPCIELCHPDLPDYSIYDIYNPDSKPYRTDHVVDTYGKSIYDIPSDAKLGEELQYSPIQRIQIDSVHSSTIHLDRAEVKEHLEQLQYPLYFLDYEAINPAIPLYNGYSPYSPMPFQYSLHIQKAQGEKLEHKQFIHLVQGDSARRLVEQLGSDIDQSGSVIIWSSYEITQNSSMASRYPEYAEFLDDLNSRCWDLMTPFQKAWYYDPKFRGRYSIKKVLPVLAPELTYDNLAIQDGATAMIRWTELLYGGGITVGFSADGVSNVQGVMEIPQTHKSADFEKEKDNLLEYCKLDTFAMVRILDALQKSVE